MRKFLVIVEENVSRSSAALTVPVRSYAQRPALIGKEDYIFKSFLPDPNVRDASLLDRVWRYSAGFGKHIAIVSNYFLLCIINDYFTFY